MSNKLVIAKPGYNALTETNPNNLVFSSDYDTLKYYASGDITVNASGNGTFVSELSHGLGYTPFYIAYVDRFASGSGRYSLCPGHFADVSIGGFPDFEITDHYVQATVYADSTKLYFQVITENSATGNFHFVYKIFRNRLGL